MHRRGRSPSAAQRAPFGTDLLFNATDLAGFAVHAEICEDVWTPIPPSTLRGAGRRDGARQPLGQQHHHRQGRYRRLLCQSQSARCIAAYLYSAAGPGESTTDLAWDGHASIYENGELLAESDAFPAEQLSHRADIDLDRCARSGCAWTTFGDNARGAIAATVPASGASTSSSTPPARPRSASSRAIARFPFVPSDPARRDAALLRGLQHPGAGPAQAACERPGSSKVVIGVSGGLDSTQALIVAAKTMDRLGLPRDEHPGLHDARLRHERADARQCADADEGAGRHGRRDRHPAGRASRCSPTSAIPSRRAKPVYDVTFENVQAGERTAHLFRLANQHDALVLGTGDLSELALGWCTYGVGDHMSHYNVNARRAEDADPAPDPLGGRVAAVRRGDARDTLDAILATEISPELVPGAGDTAPARATEDKVGPYELQDFNLYYITRYGFRPRKVAFLARHAWGDAEPGAWPRHCPARRSARQYDLAAIKKWLEVFLYRFFTISQFKRSAMPNGPKVGSGGSLSPRGDWRAPSDGNARVWLDELDENVPEG